MKTLSYLTLIFSLLFFSCGSEVKKQYDLSEIARKYQSGQVIEAQKDLELYVAKEKNNELAWTILGNIYEDTDKDSLAAIAYENALGVNPEMVEAITGLGILSRKKEAYDQAAKYYYKALAIDPNYAQAYSSLVTIHILNEEFDAAAGVGLKAFKLDPQDPVIAANLSVAYHYVDNTVERDKFYLIAENLGYSNIAGLKDIFSNDLVLVK